MGGDMDMTNDHSGQFCWFDLALLQQRLGDFRSVPVRSEAPKQALTNGAPRALG